MPNYYIWTIGCQMNKAESERLGSYFEHLGYKPTANAEEADLIVLNSCVVRQSAENRVVNKLDALKSLKKSRPSLTLAVTGCLVNADSANSRSASPMLTTSSSPETSPSGWEKPEWDQILPARPAPSYLCPYHPGLQ